MQEVPLASPVEMALIEAGEREAILLAEHLKADLVLLDDLRARRIAKARGLSVVGTLGILGDASQRGLINFRETIDALKATNFRVSDKLIESLVDKKT